MTPCFVSQPRRRIPIYHKLTMPKGTYDKEAIISYIYGSSSNTASTSIGAGRSNRR